VHPRSIVEPGGCRVLRVLRGLRVFFDRGTEGQRDGGTEETEEIEETEETEETKETEETEETKRPRDEGTEG
jgi:hypothetical protein